MKLNDKIYDTLKWVVMIVLPAIATLFQRDELVKGIVLSEVLARPTTCKWGSR